MVTLKLTGGSLGREVVLVRADLCRPECSIEIDCCEGNGWNNTGLSVSETRHRMLGLARVAKDLAADAVGMVRDEFDCDWWEVKS